MMESCFGGINYNKLLIVVVNIRCLVKVINRLKVKFRYSCKCFIWICYEIKKGGFFILFY